MRVGRCPCITLPVSSHTISLDAIAAESFGFCVPAISHRSEPLRRTPVSTLPRSSARTPHRICTSTVVEPCAIDMSRCCPSSSWGFRRCRTSEAACRPGTASLQNQPPAAASEPDMGASIDQRVPLKQLTCKPWRYLHPSKARLVVVHERVVEQVVDGVHVRRSTVRAVRLCTPNHRSLHVDAHGSRSETQLVLTQRHGLVQSGGWFGRLHGGGRPGHNNPGMSPPGVATMHVVPRGSYFEREIVCVAGSCFWLLDVRVRNRPRWKLRIGRGCCRAGKTM